MTNGLFFLLFIWPTASFSQYKLEKVKELKINSLLPVEIVDFFPKDKLYLGYIYSSEGTRITLIDEQGDLVVDKILVGEGPNQSSSLFSSLAFSLDGEIWLKTANYLYLYDQKLNFKKRINYLSGRDVNIYGRMEVLHYFSQNGPAYQMSLITNPSGTNSYIPHPKAINSIELIEINQLGKDELYKIAPVTERTMYKIFDKSMFADLYSIIYTIDRKIRRLYLTTKYDNEITVYDLINGKLESRIKINHDEFKILKNSTITESDLPSYERISVGPKNNKLFFLDGGLVVLDYVRQIPYGTFEKKIKEDPTYHHFEDPIYHRLILFDRSKQISGDIFLPKNGKLTMALPENKLLIQLINRDVEEDFVRYGIFIIVN